MAFTAARRIAMPVRTDAVTGTGATWPDGINVGNHLRVDQWDPMFHKLNDGSALFYRFLANFAKGETLYQPRFNWYEDDIQTSATTVSAIADDSSADVTAIQLTHPQMAMANAKAIVMRTGEHIHIATGHATNGIATCTRGAFGTTAATIVAGDIINIIGPHLPEGGPPQAGRSHMPAAKFNWVSFYSTTNQITDVQENTRMVNDLGSLDDSTQKAMVRLMQMMDQDLRLSRKGLEDGTQIPTDAGDGDGRIYSFDGIEAQVDASETLPVDATWLELCSIFNPYFRASGSSPGKWLFCGPTQFAVFTRLMEGRHNFRPAYEPTIGAVVQQIQLSEGGTISLVNDIHGMAAQYGTDSRGYLLDMAYVNQREFNGMGLQAVDVTASTNPHTKKREIFGSQSLQILHADSLHAVVNVG